MPQHNRNEGKYPTLPQAEREWIKLLSKLIDSGLDARPAHIALLKNVWYDGYYTGANNVKEGKLII